MPEGGWSKEQRATFRWDCKSYKLTKSRIRLAWKCAAELSPCSRRRPSLPRARVFHIFSRRQSSGARDCSALGAGSHTLNDLLGPARAFAHHVLSPLPLTHRTFTQRTRASRGSADTTVPRPRHSRAPPKGPKDGARRRRRRRGRPEGLCLGDNAANAATGAAAEDEGSENAAAEDRGAR